MKIKIISLERHREREVESLENEYLKRMGKAFQIQIVNLKPKTDASEKAKTLREEEKLIQKEVSGDDYWVVLTEEGRQYSSVELASFLGTQMKSGVKNLVFLIGGPQGISETVKKKARMLWSLSKLTLPHRLARLIMIEALYRSADILKGGPYHKS